MTLTEIRRSKDMSLGECARAAGMKPSDLSRVEMGMRRPTDQEISGIAKALSMLPEHVVNALPAERSFDEMVNDVALALRAVAADAKARGFRKGNGGQAEIQCPICKDGRLRYSVASVNGHVWGSCTKAGCVRWMQ